MINRIKPIYNQLHDVVNKIHNETKKNRLVLFFDIILCMLIYGASPNNYQYFNFYKLSAKERKTYTTHRISEKMIKKFNKPADIEFFENKLVFAKKFNSMYNREFLNADTMSFNEFFAFCKGKNKFILKPYGGAQGQNIVVYHISKQEDIMTIYQEIKTNYSKGFIIEEWICQHHVLTQIFPDAVNCLRVITVLNNNKVNIITGGVTFSLGSEIANGSQPSIVAPVNFETGVISKAGASFNTPLYEKHPVTQAQILGITLPFWNETIALVEKAARHVPSVGYVGWDIAITPTGPVLIEGNTTPGYKYYQIPAHLSDKIGNKNKYVCHL